jgi:Hemerythrin HHE cation binding domain
VDCFCLGILSTCAAAFYAATGWESSAALEFTFLILATAVNFVALMHTMTCLLRKHSVCTPEPKLSPLSFLSLTHEAIRAHLPTLEFYLRHLDLDDDSEEGNITLQLFVAHYNRFRITFCEHARQEDNLLYRCYRDWFPDHVHGKKYSEDHQRDSQLAYDDLSALVATLLDRLSPHGKDALVELRHELPAFFEHISRHFRGEEENMDPIYKKYIPLELQKQLARDAFVSTSSEKLEVIVPYVLTNLPRHEQRVSYLKSLCPNGRSRSVLSRIGTLIQSCGSGSGSTFPKSFPAAPVDGDETIDCV